MKKCIWYSFVFLLLLSGCGKQSQQQKVEARTVKVQTGALQKQEFREIFRAQGMVEASRKGTISSFVPGKIDKIFFEEGTIADAGKSLFQVDLKNLTNRVELSEKDLEVAKATRLVFTGQAEMMNEGAMDFVMVLITAVFLTFLVIAATMESLGRPFLVMFTIPLGFVGFFAMLHLTGTLLSMVGMLGAIMMIGIVVNNAILIMDETSALSKTGMKLHDAMLQASQNKFRPILMTSIASVIGMLPMAFGRGIGYEIRSSCGIGVVGGLLFAMFLTLYFIPALFYITNKDR